MQRLSTDLKYGLNRHKNGREFFEKKTRRQLMFTPIILLLHSFLLFFSKTIRILKKLLIIEM